jgi:hypothetical protein
MILNSTKFGGNRTKDLEVGLDGQTDRQTGRFLYTPQTTFVGGYKKSEALKNLELSSKQDNYRPKESEIIVLHYFVPR